MQLLLYIPIQRDLMEENTFLNLEGDSYLDCYDTLKKKVVCGNVGGLRVETKDFLTSSEVIMDFKLNFVNDEYFISFFCKKLNKRKIDSFILEYVNFIKYDFAFFLQKKIKKRILNISF